ncbi:MAG: acetyl-CoA carboxylase biotin carboxylase subunit, partial [Stenotrophobium sp.]
QKVWEEGPSPALDAAQRTKIGETVAAAMRELQYVGVGTVEFLYEDGEFYFIEMNTRIQVEHPVTEMVTNTDLIKEQIRIAAGLGLKKQQKHIKLRGHAIECRINAENPRSFVPSPGEIKKYHAPGGPGIRLDTHIYAGYKVPPHYDSMIGKLIAYGSDRKSAIARMRQALSEMVIEGIQTNIPLQRRIMDDPVFREGTHNIHYTEQMLEQWETE